MAKQRQPRTSAAQPAEARSVRLLQEVSQFMLLEREVEVEHQLRMLAGLQTKINTDRLTVDRPA